MKKLPNMAVNVATTYRSQRFQKMKHLPGSPLALHSDAHYLIIKIPDSRFLKLFTSFFILTLFIVSFQCIRFLPSSTSPISQSINAFSDNTVTMDLDSDSIKLQKLLPLLFRDLKNEGILGGVHYRAVFVCNGANEAAAIKTSGVVDNNVQIISVKDLDRLSSVLNNEFDFAFTSNLANTSEFIDRTLKPGGVVTVLHANNPSAKLQKPSNYRIVYMRQFESTVMAMRKTGQESETQAGLQRKLFEYRSSEAKKRAALNRLEDVLLEPPRAASRKSRRYMKRTRYLPDLMGDSLESYPRRVFIDVGLPEKRGGSGTGWFDRHYPKKNKDFETYKIETVAEESSVRETEMSDWLRRNVKEEEYVVMKADAEVVEDLMKSRAISLVDELFMECRPDSGKGRVQGNEAQRRKRRAYWECLSLYGRLRDEGIAVHQWWG